MLTPKNFKLVKSLFQEKQLYANFSKIIREGILLALSLSTTLLLYYNDMKNRDSYLLRKVYLSYRGSLHDLLREELAPAKKKQIKSTLIST